MPTEYLSLSSRQMTPDANGTELGPMSKAGNIVIKDPNNVLAGN